MPSPADQSPPLADAQDKPKDYLRTDRAEILLQGGRSRSLSASPQAGNTQNLTDKHFPTKSINEMKENVLTGQDEPVFSLLRALDKTGRNLRVFMKDCRPLLNGERYLTDKDVSALLRISRRTLQDYRRNGILPFFRLGGKILYRESDLQKLLSDSCKPSFNCISDK